MTVQQQFAAHRVAGFAYLLCLLNKCLPEKFPGNILYNAACFLQALVDGNSSNLRQREIAIYLSQLEPVCRRAGKVSSAASHDKLDTQLHYKAIESLNRNPTHHQSKADVVSLS